MTTYARRVRRAPAASLALGAVLGLGAVATGQPVPAAAATVCPGVLVVVDFAALGGGVQTRCADGDPSSGVAALTGAGFTVTPTQRRAGFVCRIAGKPASDPCQVPAPATAYWSYWHANPGGSWSYSSAGAGSYDPKPGTVEGWAFGAGDQPSIAPPAFVTTTPTPTAPVPKPTPTPKPPATSKPPAQPSAAPGGPGTPTRPPGTGGAPAVTAPPPGGTTSGPSATGSPSTAATATTERAGPTVTPGDRGTSDVLAAGGGETGDGGPGPSLVLAGAFLVALAAAAAVSVRRRR